MPPSSSAATGHPAIRCHDLGKKYRIGGPRERYLSLRDRLMSMVARPFRSKHGAGPEIWALRGVSFEVNPGERVGIIGRNGAGKSTLLKLLSRITEPTEGGFQIRGRVASLLEVGTGFHPELTGRENVYLSGAILGMRKSEVQAKFDEIVDFAEMGTFLDTPAKRYSSGMYMRLAFAVAAHLDPEILLVDEVLAVGDAQFQQKCLGKMNRVSNSGRTVLFVSHQMPAVQALCERAILLSGGGIAESGPTRDVIATYLTGGNQPQATKIDVSTCRDRTKFTEMAIKEVWIENDQGAATGIVGMGQGVTLCYRFQASRPLFNPGFGFGIDDRNGARLFSANNYFMPQPGLPRSATQGVVRCRFPSLPLLPATYHVSISLVEDERTLIDYVERVASFTVEPADVLGSGKIPRSDQGIFFLPAKIELDV